MKVDKKKAMIATAKQMSLLLLAATTMTIVVWGIKISSLYFIIEDEAPIILFGIVTALALLYVAVFTYGLYLDNCKRR